MDPAMQMYNLNVKNWSRTGWNRWGKSGVFFLGGAIFLADTVLYCLFF
jgi:hypothetical protein